MAAGAQIMNFSVAPEKMRRLIASISDSIGATMRTSGRLPLFGAIVTFAAREAGIPSHSVACPERLASPIMFQSVPKRFNASDCFMAKYHRKGDGQLAFPQMHIRAANACHFRANQSSARLKMRRKRIFSNF
jgi:hypothetical protein